MITKEVMCIACKRRWVAKIQEDIPLNKYDCPYCLYPKGLFYTGDTNVVRKIKTIRNGEVVDLDFCAYSI